MKLYVAVPTYEPEPHVCRENETGDPVKVRFPKSSPRVRGKLCSRFVVPLVEEVIPACTGKTPCDRRSCVKPRSHPRVYGENTSWLG